MKHAKISILALLAVFVLAVPVGAIAQQGLDNRKNATEIRQDAVDEIKNAKADKAAKGEEKSEEARIAACERRQVSIQKKATRYVENANKYQAVVDKLFERVQGFYESGQLTAANYEELVATAEQARIQSQESVQVLAQVNQTVDCSDPDVAAQGVASFRGAAGQTKTQLRNYSTSIKNIISAMQSPNSSANSGEEPVDSSDADVAEPVEVEDEVAPTTPDVPPPSDQEGI